MPKGGAPEREGGRAGGHGSPPGADEKETAAPPPPLPPSPRATGAPPLYPPRGREGVPPPPERTMAPGRGTQPDLDAARPNTPHCWPPRRSLRASEPTPARKTSAHATPVGGAPQRTGAVWGRAPTAWTSPVTPAMLPARGGQRDGPRQHDPPPPRPPGHPPGGAARGPPPPPPPGWPAGGGQPHDPGRTRSQESDAPATSGGLSRGPRAAPHRGGGGEPRLDPPRSPNPSHRPASQGDAGPHPLPGRGSDPPSPRQDRGARKGGQSRARLHAPAVCSRRHRDGQANLGAKGATRTAPGNST